jgi:hypothetical protein
MSDFETVPVGTTAELERVKKERDDWRRMSEQYKREAYAALERESALAAQLDGLRRPALALADAVENRDDLPLQKWALKCARLVSQVQKSGSESPTTSLARRKAEALQ